MKRNQFIRYTLAGTAALFAVNWGTLAQIRQYKEQNKPLLTEANLSRFFTKYKKENNLEPFNEAISDTKVFLEKYFSISPQQKNTISRMNDDNWKDIQSIIKDARDEKGILNFKFVTLRTHECQTQVVLLQNTNNTGLPNRNTSPAELRKVIIQ